MLQCITFTHYLRVVIILWELKDRKKKSCNISFYYRATEPDDCPDFKIHDSSIYKACTYIGAGSARECVCSRSIWSGVQGVNARAENRHGKIPIYEDGDGNSRRFVPGDYALTRPSERIHAPPCILCTYECACDRALHGPRFVLLHSIRDIPHSSHTCVVGAQCGRVHSARDAWRWYREYLAVTTAPFMGLAGGEGKDPREHRETVYGAHPVGRILVDSSCLGNKF